MRLRTSTWVFFVLGAGVLAAGVWGHDRTVRRALMDEAGRTAGRQVAALASQIDRELDERRRAVAAATDAVLTEVLERPAAAAVQRANTYCDAIARALRPAVAYLMDATGTVVASSNRAAPDSFLGRNYGFRRYFSLAMQGDTAVVLARGVTSGRRGIYFSVPVTDAGGRALGVFVIKRAVDTIDEEFAELAQLGEIVLVSPEGVVFSSTVPGWRFGTYRELDRGALAGIAASQQFGAGPWPWIGLRSDGEGGVRGPRGSRYRPHPAQLAALPGWQVVYLHDLDKTYNAVVLPLARHAVQTLLPGLLLIAAVSVALFVLVQRAITREEALVADLQRALAEVRTLRGILPICTYCKKIRTDQGAWDQLEAYLSEHTEADFSHGICPDCLPRARRDLGLKPER